MLHLLRASTCSPQTTALYLPAFCSHRSVPKHLLTPLWSCPQSGPGAHNTSNEKVLWRQSLLLHTALSEQVRHTRISLHILISSVSPCSHHIISSPLFFRYIYYFGGLLSGTIKMNSSPLFLHQVLIPSLPHFQAGGGQFYTSVSRTVACSKTMKPLSVYN